jgi:adenosyl cobinamide kinase/adenosyl cobinamide phosphate guanylyltransferase
MITLLLGGARSGKSELAERLAAASGDDVTYLATAVPGDDPDFAARISAHRARRPASWTTVEAGRSLVAALRSVEGAALVDSLGTWIVSVPDFDADLPGLCSALQARSAPTIVVSEEVGLGVHPSTAVGGRFRDALGRANQAVSAVADEAFLVVAGRTLRLDAFATPGR